MKHCQYCRSTEQVEQTQLIGENDTASIWVCERCYMRGVMFDECPRYTVEGVAEE